MLTYNELEDQDSATCLSAIGSWIFNASVRWETLIRECPGYDEIILDISPEDDGTQTPFEWNTLEIEAESARLRSAWHRNAASRYPEFRLRWWRDSVMSLTLGVPRLTGSDVSLTQSDRPSIQLLHNAPGACGISTSRARHTDG